jgi:hypothetical protein
MYPTHNSLSYFAHSTQLKPQHFSNKFNEETRNKPILLFHKKSTNFNLLPHPKSFLVISSFKHYDAVPRMDSNGKTGEPDLYKSRCW